MIRSAAVILLLATSAEAQSLRFPSNAEMTAETTEASRTFELPTAAWDGTSVPSLTVEGDMTTQAWQIDAPDLTLLQLTRPLREQLRNEGYEVLFECETRACGGFDFRFALDVLPPPAMFVNLGDFRQLSAWRAGEDGTDEAISLLISRSNSAGFVQLTHVGKSGSDISSAEAPALRGATPAIGLAASLQVNGRAILDGLTFERGSARLADGGEGALQELADFLAAEPGIEIALVGHTDSEGSLSGNITLSKRRAASVLERLATDYGINRARMEAEGMGYLAPVANNQTAEGREANRRVEVIVTSIN